MPSVLHRMHVELEDGEEFNVATDQRDSAKWEQQEFGCSVADLKPKLLTYQRFVAWSAAKRQGLTKLSWDKWQDACVCVEPAEDGPADDAEDPGRTAA